MKSKFIQSIFSFRTLVILLLIGFQIHNYLMNQEIKGLLDDVYYRADEALNYASEASDYAQSAYLNAYGSVCSYCPD